MDTLKAAFNDSFIPQMVLTREGTIIAVNEPATRVLKQPDLVGAHHTHIMFESQIPSDLAQEFELKNLQNWQTEQQYLKGDGTVMWARVSISAIRNQSKVEAFLLQLQDITEHKQTEEDLHKYHRDMDQFVSIASHDLREPLIAVAGFAELLKKRYAKSLDGIGLHFLEEILNSARRMEKKIDDLLAFSKAGRDTTSDVFQIREAVDEARRSVSYNASKARATFDIPDDLPIVQGDRSMIAQVFQNLFSNSLKYKREDQAPHITVRAEPHGDNIWVVSVMDNGVGFDMRHKDRIFGIFQRLYTSEEYPGTGIGLAIAKKIIERHRGRIWTSSEPGKGSQFCFTLKAVPQP